MNKQASDANETDIRPEYDFSGGGRGQYAATLREEGYTIREYNADGTFTEIRVLGQKTITLTPEICLKETVRRFRGVEKEQNV